MGAREAGVLVRPLGAAVAASPPLTAEPEHFTSIAEAIEHGLGKLPAQEREAELKLSPSSRP